jgi:hypothetical protein
LYGIKKDSALYAKASFFYAVQFYEEAYQKPEEPVGDYPGPPDAVAKGKVRKGMADKADKETGYGTEDRREDRHNGWSQIQIGIGYPRRDGYEAHQYKHEGGPYPHGNYRPYRKCFLSHISSLLY